MIDDFHEFAQEVIKQSGITLNSFTDEFGKIYPIPLYTISEKKMNPTIFFNAAIEIARLANNILQLVNSEADESVIQTHFQSIGKIASSSAAKPEIQGYSEHE